MIKLELCVLCFTRAWFIDLFLAAVSVFLPRIKTDNHFLIMMGYCPAKKLLHHWVSNARNMGGCEVFGGIVEAAA